MKENPLLALSDLGQSTWLDLIRRGMLRSGELQQLIAECDLRGVTSNPSIFEKAIAGSHDYDAAIRVLALEGKGAAEMLQALTVEDIQQAADLFRPTYDRLEGSDGFVSLEVSPHLAHDTAGTIQEGRRLWAAVNRPNVMIKVPGTREGIPAIRTLLGEGINVNVTLLFGLPRYREVVEAFLAGAEVRAAGGASLGRLASVASFFLSRIDVLVDPVLEKAAREGGAAAALAASLQGQVAICSAKAAYQIFQESFGAERFRQLAGRGARPQRLLWASTGTKNPAYSDVKYVEALIGPDTIDTMPLETLNAYRDHGQPASRLTEGLADAAAMLARLPEVGIDLDAVTQRLEDEGVRKFVEPYDQLLRTLERKREATLREPVDRQLLQLGSHEKGVQAAIDRLDAQQFCTRLWRKDPSLWKVDPRQQKGIREALGWLHVAEKMEEQQAMLREFAAEVRGAGFRHVLDMGMGGSSLAPLALSRVFSPGPGGLPLTVLDTTDPTTIPRIERELPLAETLFILASKSGTTAEPLAFGDYFFAKVKAAKGERVGENFVVITDPGTSLVALAEEKRFRRAFANFSDIGGRYSALSYFGLLPAALMDLDVGELLVRALRMAHACASCVPGRENPGLALGATLGELARRGRNKVTLLMPPPIAALGMWLEQLLAESTGKEGVGLVPVTGESLGPPAVYGKDRLFVAFQLEGAADEALERGVAALRAAGHPVVRIQMADRLDVGQEFFRWEVATAVAGAILRINPFDQPNVQESKDNTNRLLDQVRKTGQLPEPKPTLTEGPLQFSVSGSAWSVRDLLRDFLARVRPGDYLALLAYLPESPETEAALQALRLALRDSLRLATTVGYGPRYLHSTGQLYKGGPNTGVFLQLTADDSEDAPIPGAPYTFGAFKRAQALGDLQALRRHRRRVLRVHLGGEVTRGLTLLREAVRDALGAG